MGDVYLDIHFTGEVYYVAYLRLLNKGDVDLEILGISRSLSLLTLVVKAF
jgi:hypothetical protein